jgi:hypothetical protein
MKFFCVFAGKKVSLKWEEKKLERLPIEQLFSIAMTMLIPSHVLEHFEMWDTHEYKDRWVIEMREKEGKIPSELTGYNDIVFDGYCNPLETLSHSFVCKSIWLKLYRRRYKRAGTDNHYSNEYDVSLKGVRMVPELGFF